MVHHTKSIIPVSIPTVPQLRPVLEAISRGSSPIPPEQVLFSLILICYILGVWSLVSKSWIWSLSDWHCCLVFVVLFSCWRRQSSKGTTKVLTSALILKKALREAVSRPACLSRPTASPARCSSTLWHSTPALSPSNTAIATAANPSYPPCMVMVWEPIPHWASSPPPACWPTTAAASPTITSSNLQTLSSWLREGLLQLGTTLTLWLWPQMGLWFSVPLLMPTALCLWALPDSLLNLEIPHLLCRASPLGIPRLPSKVSSKETLLRLFKGWCQETLRPKAWHHETSPLQVWRCEIWPLKVSETASVISVHRAWHLRNLPPCAMTTFQKPSWHLSTRDGRWRRGTGCCVSKPDPRPSMAQIWGSMTSPAGGVYPRTTSDHQAHVARPPRPTAPGSFWWAQASSVIAWGPRLSPAPPRRR